MCTYKVTSKPTGRSYLQELKVSPRPRVTSRTCTRDHRHAPQSRRGEAHRATNVHRITKHVKREALDAVIHQNAEIVSQERARDAKRPGRRHDEGLPENEKGDGDEGIERGGEDARMRLF